MFGHGNQDADYLNGRHSEQPAGAQAAGEGQQALPDDGFVWMTHPSRCDGKPIPVRMSVAGGVRYYQPFDEDATDFEWDERDSEWKLLASPAVAPSAQPVRMLTDDDIKRMRTESRADPRCVDEHWFVLFVRAVEKHYGIGAAPSAQEPQAATAPSAPAAPVVAADAVRQETGWERRQGFGTAADRRVLRWSNWVRCSEAEAQRVRGLRSWQVRQVLITTAAMHSTDAREEAK